MTRDELFERVRDHLTTELAVGPSAIPDDEAARMETVGQVVDHAHARAPERAS